MNLQDFIVTKETSILEAMNKIDKNSRGIIYICDVDKLIGVATDGDIRRYILKNGNLSAPINEIMNRNPKYIFHEDTANADNYIKMYKITSVPVVDRNYNVVSIKFSNSRQIYKNTNLNIPVVIMAGGKGTRLYPYTKILPKPLLPIGDSTITELIMEKFESFGCDEFNIIVNYKKDLIKSYFNDNEHKRNIIFTDEKEFYGTGGGLTLIADKYKETFFMTNCDILVNEDYGAMIDYHKNSQNIITLVCAVKNVTIPYGTIDISSEGQIVKITEKPSNSYMINTGLYIIEPEFVELIPKNQFIHITDVIQSCINDGKRVGAYPVSENAWLDMGQFEEMEKMKERLHLNE
jgi:dTDP-glucose pyrophosphorylase